MIARWLLAICAVLTSAVQAEEVLNFDSSKRTCVAHSDSSWGYYGQLSTKRGDGRQQILLPNDWGLRYAACGHSLAPLHRQSPIELPRPEAMGAAGHGDVRFMNYGVRTVQVEHNCHTVQATIVEGDSPAPAALEVAGRGYRLLQFHIHTPSEHVIRDSERGTSNYPAEVHFVHAAVREDGSVDGGRLAVVGVFIDIADTAPDPLVDDFFREMAERYAGTRTLPSETGIEVDIGKLASMVGSFWRYQGSLTTPPCSETVEWIVLAQPLKIGVETYQEWQKEKLSVGFANSRPPLLPTAHHQLRFNQD
jgi:carbonic anhydrase